MSECARLCVDARAGRCFIRDATEITGAAARTRTTRGHESSGWGHARAAAPNSYTVVDARACDRSSRFLSTLPKHISCGSSSSTGASFLPGWWDIDGGLLENKEATEPPPRAPARAPPFWQGRALRRRHEERPGRWGCSRNTERRQSRGSPLRAVNSGFGRTSIHAPAPAGSRSPRTDVARPSRVTSAPPVHLRKNR